MSANVPDTLVRPPLTDNQRRWLDHIGAAKSAGLTDKAYAAREDLSLSAMYAAKAILREKGHLPPTEVNLVPVRVAPSSEGALCGTLRLHLPNGIVIEAGTGAGVAPLAQLVKALQ